MGNYPYSVEEATRGYDNRDHDVMLDKACHQLFLYSVRVLYCVSIWCGPNQVHHSASSSTTSLLEENSTIIYWDSL